MEDEAKEGAGSVNTMHAIMVKDGEQYFIQGIEVDYAAAHDSVVATCEAFVYGLTQTMELRREAGLPDDMGSCPNNMYRRIHESGDSVPFAWFALPIKDFPYQMVEFSRANCSFDEVRETSP